jgi:hypothetical protein
VGAGIAICSTGTSTGAKGSGTGLGTTCTGTGGGIGAGAATGAGGSGSTRSTLGGVGVGVGGGNTGCSFNSTGFSGGSSIALACMRGGVGGAISVTVLSFGSGKGTGELMGLFGCSGRTVIGARYWTTERTDCTMGADCHASQSKARCRTPVVSRAVLETGAAGLMQRAILQSAANPHCRR